MRQSLIFARSRFPIRDEGNVDLTVPHSRVAGWVGVHKGVGRCFTAKAWASHTVAGSEGARSARDPHGLKGGRRIVTAGDYCLHSNIARSARAVCKTMNFQFPFGLGT